MATEWGNSPCHCSAFGFMSELDTFLLGLLDCLRHHPNVHAVRETVGESARVRDVRQWEQKHAMKLPTDVQQFYQTFNGFSVEWDILIKDLPVCLGRIAITPVLSLCKAPDELCKMVEGALEGTGCSVFVLDSSQQFGTVCLAINTTSGGYSICYLPVGGGVPHRVASSLQAYLRLALIHLGLQQWQLKVATGQVSCHLKMWYSLFIPSPSPSPSSLPPHPDVKEKSSSAKSVTNILDQRMLLSMWQGTGKTLDSKQESRQMPLTQKKQPK